MHNWGRVPAVHFAQQGHVPIVQKGGNMRKGRNVKSRLNKVLEVPDEVALRVPKLTILKFEEVLIENYKGILEYQDFFVRIQTNIGIININGFKLSLDEMTIDDLIVRGKIESIDFESITDSE